jgi:hypothetical protein
VYKPDGFLLTYRNMNNENNQKVGPIRLAANVTQYLLGNLGKTDQYIYRIRPSVL